MRPTLPRAARPPIRRAPPRLIPRRPPAWAGGRRATDRSALAQQLVVGSEVKRAHGELPFEPWLSLEPLLFSLAALGAFATLLTHHAAPALAFPLYLLTLAACAVIAVRALLHDGAR